MAIAAIEQLLEWRLPRIAATLAADHRGARRARHRSWASARRPRTSADRTFSASPCPPRHASARFPRSPAANCFAAMRGGSLRIAPHLHTTPEDVDRLIGALAGALD